MTHTPSTSSCPDCGEPLPANSPQALCPACLMRQALASRTLIENEGKRSAAPPPSPEEIADKFPQFEIIECLGRGGMGVVYKARQKSLNRLVAIKILAPEREHEPHFAERFAREAELLAKLSHPHIVTIHDFGVADSQLSTTTSQPLYYLVMEFVDGVDLRDLLRDGKLEAKQALAIVPPICEALQYAHDKGIVHRDIKPENLLLDRDGRIKIADFGIAALIGAGGENIGTPPYMAPEQSGDTVEVDSRADIYALGVVLYEMLTGERPGKDLVAPSKKVQIDVRLDEMVLRALEMEPKRRYQTAGEFRTVIETMQRPPLNSNPPPIPNSSPPRGMFRRWWWLFLVMIPLGLALGLAGGAVLNYVLPKKYEAQTIIEVKPEAEVQITPQFFATEFERLKSRKALAAVAKRLELEKLWMLGEAEVIRILKGIISVQNIRGTDLLSIHVRHTNAQDATAIANTLSLVYQESSPNKLLVHETAVVPKHPVSPNLKLNLVLAAFTGLISSPLVALLGMMILQRLIPERRSKQASFVKRSGSPPDLLPMRSEHKIGLTLALHALLFAVLFGLFFFVVPPWATLMSKFEPPLPTIPSILYRISNMPRIWVMIALLVLIVIDVSGCFISNKSGGRRALRFWSIGVITVLVLTVFLMGLAISKPLLHLTSDLNQENQLRPTGRELNQNAKASNQRMSWILEKNPPLAAAAPGLDLAPTFPLQSDAVGWAEFDGQFNPVMYLALPFPRGGSEGPVDGPRRTPGAPIQLNIYRGTNALATANRFLGSYEFTCQPPDAVLRAEFSLSSEGILHLNVYPDGDGVMIAGRQVRQPDPPDKPSGGIRKMVVTPEQSAEAEQDNRNEKITVEDLALQMIVAIREKNDAKLKSLASDQVKGWPDALPVFAVELREHFRQFTGNENFDLKTGESLVEGDLAAVRCTGPVELEGKCLVLFFVKTKEGWRNYSLRNSTVGNSLEKHLADLKVAIRKQE